MGQHLLWKDPETYGTSPFKLLWWGRLTYLRAFGILEANEEILVYSLPFPTDHNSIIRSHYYCIGDNFFLYHYE